MSDGNVPAYIGRCAKCGGVNAACVDDGVNMDRKEVSRFVASIVKRGGTVERKTVGWVRESAHGEWCSCKIDRKRPSKQEEMLLVERASPSEGPQT